MSTRARVSLLCSTSLDHSYLVYSMCPEMSSTLIDLKLIIGFKNLLCPIHPEKVYSSNIAKNILITWHGLFYCCIIYLKLISELTSWYVHDAVNINSIIIKIKSRSREEFWKGTENFMNMVLCSQALYLVPLLSC